MNWRKNHAFLMGALGASLKYTKNLDNALQYFNQLQELLESEEISKAIWEVEMKQMFRKDICPECLDGDPERVGYKKRVDDGFTCKACGGTYI